MPPFPGSPRLFKGGIVLIDPETSASRRIIALQYNPETLSRTLQVQGVSEGGDRSKALHRAHRRLGRPKEKVGSHKQGRCCLHRNMGRRSLWVKTRTKASRPRDPSDQLGTAINSTSTSSKGEVMNGNGQSLGIVENGEFQRLAPPSELGGPTRLTSISPQASQPPESGELDLSEQEGSAIMVSGLDQGQWIFSAEVID
jgi:hypothetical protein